MKQYIGMVTTDWSECLAPCGPFDMITYHYPHLRDDLENIFRGYTGHAMTLAQAVARIDKLLPAPIGKGQMDAYLENEFEIYADVAAFMAWCRDNGIMFMINSTGAMGYFQRVLARGLLTQPEVLAAHPMIKFETAPSDPQIILPIIEIRDKPVHSAAMARRFRIPHERIVVIGDSGGDGPHFEWGARTGATLIASLAKSSLLDYCRSRNIEIQHQWNPGQAVSNTDEAHFSGRPGLDKLIRVIQQIMER